MSSAKARNVVILVPSLAATGPVKGAIALANGLARSRPVTLVALKDAGGLESLPEPGVRLFRLGELPWSEKRRRCREILAEHGDPRDTTLVSSCFSADCMAATLGRKVRKVSSVRGNLVMSYRLDHGPLGRLLAWAHYRVIRRMDRVIALSDAMKLQLEALGIPDAEIVPNFLEEAGLAAYLGSRKARAGGPVRFGFLGRLTSLKRPELLIDQICSPAFPDSRLELVGEGALRAELEARAKQAGKPERATFHGQLAEPWKALSSVDYLVLPSESEGTSRAVLEALYLGIPCIMRDVCGNSELIQDGRNGYLFQTDAELGELLTELASGRKSLKDQGGSLLPELYRQDACVSRFAAVIDGA